MKMRKIIFLSGILALVSSISHAFPSPGKCMRIKEYSSVESKLEFGELYGDGKLTTLAVITDTESLLAYGVESEDGFEDVFYFLKSNDKYIGVYKDSTRSGGSPAIIEVKTASNRSFVFKKTTSDIAEFKEFNNYTVSIDLTKIENDLAFFSKKICNTFDK